MFWQYFDSGWYTCQRIGANFQITKITMTKILHDPSILILDEPTNGLDPQRIIDLRKYLRHLADDRKKTILISSHLLSEMELIADQYGIMQNGELLQIQENDPSQQKVRYLLQISGLASEKCA